MRSDDDFNDHNEHHHDYDNDDDDDDDDDDDVNCAIWWNYGWHWLMTDGDNRW